MMLKENQYWNIPVFEASVAYFQIPDGLTDMKIIFDQFSQITEQIWSDNWTVTLMWLFL